MVDEGEKVIVMLVGQVVLMVVCDGKWSVRFVLLFVGGFYVFMIVGKNWIEIIDVFIGEVWVCGGQFNMEC